MLRTILSIAFVLALALAPAAHSAQDLGVHVQNHGQIDPNGQPAASQAGPELLAATGCALGSCGEVGGVTDPNGQPMLLSATGCALGSCAEIGGVIDPDGQPMLLAGAGCALGSCGEVGGVIDPNGLTAAGRPTSPAARLITWVRALLAV